MGDIDPDYTPPEGVIFNKSVFAFKLGEKPFGEWNPFGYVRERWRKGKLWAQPYRLTTEAIVLGWRRVGRAPPESLPEWFPEEGFKDFTIICVPFAYGLVVLSQEEYRQEDEPVVQGLTEALSLGFVRFLDFQRLEEANRRIQQATERKSRFLANMSHELRTPMNAILGFTRMVLRRAGDALPERQKENLGKVIEAGNRLLGLINDLLDLSKIEAGRMDVEVKRFRVETLVRSCCSEIEPLVAKKLGVDLVCDVADDVGEAETDEGRVRQIVMNLLGNAIKFTDQGEVAVRVRRETDDIVIAVSDTGAGIPQDALDTVFEEFQQVKGSDAERRGTGLGLPTCKGFAELLGGSIRVESEVGKGSTFTIRIPMIYIEF